MNENVSILNFRLGKSSILAQIHPRSQMFSPVASQSAAFGTEEAQCCLYPLDFKQFCSSVGWFLAEQTEMMKGLGGIISFPIPAFM